jgi:hypothetical protein
MEIEDFANNSQLFLKTRAEMRYFDISKEMSSLYFGLALFCLFEARVLEFDTLPLPPTSCRLYRYSVEYTGLGALRPILGL